MKTTSIRARTLACALLATTAFCGLTAEPAAAQTAREHRALDANGVDLTHGDFVMAFVEGSIGSGEAELALVRTGVWTPAASNGHEWDGVILVQDSGSGLVNNHVYLGTTLVPFRNSDTSPDGSATLTGSGSSYVYRSADGTEIAFGDPTGNSEPGSNLCNGSEGQTHCSLLPLSIASPDGRTLTIAWDTSSYCPFNGSCTYYTRIASLSNSFGYRIAFAYAGGLNANGIPTPGWFQRTGAAFYNDPVSTTTVQASTGYAYPATGVTEVTDMGGRTWRFTGTANGVTGIRRPGASSDTTSIAYSTGSSVSSVTGGGMTTSYSRSVSGSTATMTVTQVDGDPNTADPQTLVVSDLAVGRPTSVTDPTSRTTAYEYHPGGLLKRVTAPEGNYVEHSYDGRGNLVQTVAVPKGGSGATIVISAAYDSTCSNPVTCNRPNSTTDERGNVTDYEYDPVHGGVTKVTGPAVAGVRPQTRYTYSLTNGEYRLTGTSACQTGQAELNSIPAACLGTADEVKTAIGYDLNGNVTSASTASGDGDPTQAAATAMTYDALGNLRTVDGPLTDADDVTHVHYRPGTRELIVTIGPDPDGSGILKRRAVRNVVDPQTGLTSRVEQGNAAGESDLAWLPAQAVETQYDAHARPIAGRLTAGGATYALTQTRYDSLGRVECVARRMNPAGFASPPQDACAPGPEGIAPDDHGPDRIVRTVYDPAGRVTGTRTVTAGGEVSEGSSTYTPNGLVETLTDGENNRTTYVYDGHDRLSRTYFPLPAQGAGHSATPQNTLTPDYEELTYEPVAGGRTSPLVASFRNRAGETIAFGYDSLGRLSSKDMPGSELDIGYGYDLLGRKTSASQPGQSLTFDYDALGRQLSQSEGSRTYSSRYDPAGRRTRLTHPDGFFVEQDHLVTGEVTKIREYGATSGIGVLATYEYDDLGRRDRLTLGNGAVTDYQYDAVSRLQSLTHDLADTASDNIITFAYNPAFQIEKREASNPLYAWTGHGNGTTTYQVDGLNRLTSQTTGGSTLPFAHDARSNRLNDEARTYTYDSENKARGLATGPWHYDPLGRLSGVSTSPGTPPALVYENYVDRLVAERVPGSANVSRRHVFGPGVDEPLVWYEGSDRRFLQADERGSIVAVTDGTGTLRNVNRYDEYGRTQNSNNFYLSRFAYTGQRYFSGFAIYHYKNRLYDQDTGRFMQPDPIGYEAGLNLYAYVGGDPVNWTDPWGLNPEEDDEEAEEQVVFINGPASSGGARGGGAAGALLLRAGRSRGPAHRAELLPGPALGGNPAECGDAACTTVVIAARRPSQRLNRRGTSWAAVYARSRQAGEPGDSAAGLISMLMDLGSLSMDEIGPSAVAGVIVTVPLTKGKVRRLQVPPTPRRTVATTVDRSEEIRRLKAADAAKRLHDRQSRSGRWPGWVNDIFEFFGS